jgi:hypothetical protein
MPRRDFDRRDGERRSFDRGEPGGPPRSAPPAAGVPGPAAAQRAPVEPRGAPSFEGRGYERRSDEGRNRPPPVQQAPIAPPRSAPQPPPQRFLDANEERPAHRRPREARD